jgi:cell division protein FtsB
MVTNSRWRSVFSHLGLWLVAAAAIAYFSHHAMTGPHGLTARRAFEQETTDLKARLADMVAERKSLEHRLDLLGDDTLDPDLLEEETRSRLGWLGPRDRVLILPTR